MEVLKETNLTFLGENNAVFLKVDVPNLTLLSLAEKSEICFFEYFHVSLYVKVRLLSNTLHYSPGGDKTVLAGSKMTCLSPFSTTPSMVIPYPASVPNFTMRSISSCGANI